MDTIEVVSVEDPALDRDKMDVRKYAATRDASLIVELPGMKAVRWTLRDLTMLESQTCDRQSNMLDKFNCALGYGLVKIDDGKDGLVPKAVVPDKENGGNKTIWSNEGLALIWNRYRKAVYEEIATIICQRDERSGEAFGGGAPSFTLPPLSQDALVRIERRHAESSRGRSGETQTS